LDKLRAGVPTETMLTASALAVDMKFRSCMTLFSLAMDGPDNPFHHALDRWCGGRSDEQTLALIDAGGRSD
jgi:uncharacterized protein (DUF1810 family)